MPRPLPMSDTDGTTSTDLWGNPIPPERTTGKLRGYAGNPGRGPKGETCRTCEFYRHRLGRYRKCGLLERVWTHGPGTDILAGSPACQFWKPKPP